MEPKKESANNPHEPLVLPGPIRRQWLPARHRSPARGPGREATRWPHTPHEATHQHSLEAPRLHGAAMRLVGGKEVDPIEANGAVGPRVSIEPTTRSVARSPLPAVRSSTAATSSGPSRRFPAVTQERTASADVFIHSGSPRFSSSTTSSPYFSLSFRSSLGSLPAARRALTSRAALTR